MTKSTRSGKAACLSGSPSQTIWALTQIAMLHDQPENDLVAWWRTKPSLDQLAYAIERHELAKCDDEAILAIVEVWRLRRKVHGNVEWHLRQLPEGLIRGNEIGEGEEEQAL